jgi:hypothetical protein
VVSTGKINHGRSGDGHGYSPEEWNEYWPSVDSSLDGTKGTPSKHGFTFATGTTMAGRKAMIFKLSRRKRRICKNEI